MALFSLLQMPDPPSHQFSVRALFAIVLASAVMCAVVFVLPDAAASACILIVFFLMPMLVIPAIIYCEGRLRAFCIGAAIPATIGLAVVTVFIVIVVFDGRSVNGVLRILDRIAMGIRGSFLACTVMAIVGGYCSVRVHSLRRKRQMNEDRHA